jgi:hypothetical protein
MTGGDVCCIRRSNQQQQKPLDKKITYATAGGHKSSIARFCVTILN